MASASTRILDNNLQLLFSTNHRTTHSRPCLFKADSIKNSYSLRSSWSPIKVTSSQGQHSAGNTPYVPKTDYQSSSSSNKYALVSVSDKTDLPLIGRGLQNLGYVIISTRGTASALESAGVSVIVVKDLRVFPVIVEGREKFFDLNIFDGRLARRDPKDLKEALDKFRNCKIDVVVANLLPEKDISIDEVVEFEDGTDNVDGGNFTITAAVKKFEDVLVVVDPEDYPVVLEFLKRNQDNKRFRLELASKAFKHTIASDYVLAYRARKRVLTGEFPRKTTQSKNPHQKAAFCVGDVIAEVNNKVIDTAIRHHGKEMRYLDYIDADAAWNCISEFKNPTCVIVKDRNPCGVASRDDMLEAYRLAVKGDPASVIGGVLAFNVEADKSLAREIREFRSPTDGRTRMLYETVIAPKYSEEGFEILRKISNNLRILETRPNKTGKLSIRQILYTPEDIQFNVVSENAPRESELRDAKFAWLCARHVKSDAMVIAKNNCLLGIGSGQENCQELLRTALRKAGDEVKGAVLANTVGKDAIEEACRSGIRVIVEHEWSRFDEDATNCCNKYGVSLLYAKYIYYNLEH